MDMNRVAKTETALTEWKRQGEEHDAERDPLVRAAHQAGLNVHRIYKLSGVSRTTIYKILGLPGPAEDRPTRIVRARDLVKGATIVGECAGPGGCGIPADAHTSPSQHVTHCRTLLEDPEADNRKIFAIAVLESGEQTEVVLGDGVLLRVFADSMPQTGTAS